MDELTRTVEDENEVVQVLFRLPRHRVAKLDRIAGDMLAASRNHALDIIIDSIEEVHPARATVKLPKTAKVTA